jgi:Family of unknown function (DUF6644)
MVRFQMWIVSTFAGATSVRHLMQTTWGWPAAESLHFIGLSLLVGTIFVFDLRLLGIGRRIPIGALHRLIPWGLAGFACTFATGMLFLLAEPDQYVYNPSFHFKMLFMLLAGLNASMFYLTSYRRVTADGAPADVPRSAQIVAAASILLWLSVIVAGRLLTFHRPAPCEGEAPTVLAECIPNYYR